MPLEVRAVTKYVRMSAHKVRLVADMVRGKRVPDALTLLRFANKAAARPVAKTIASAAANADENYGLAIDNLYVSRIMVDEGPTLKRGRPGARGRYKPILKRGSHISVIVAERE